MKSSLGVVLRQWSLNKHISDDCTSQLSRHLVWRYKFSTISKLRGSKFHKDSSRWHCYLLTFVALHDFDPFNFPVVFTLQVVSFFLFLFYFFPSSLARCDLSFHLGCCMHVDIFHISTLLLILPNTQLVSMKGGSSIFMQATMLWALEVYIASCRMPMLATWSRARRHAIGARFTCRDASVQRGIVILFNFTRTLSMRGNFERFYNFMIGNQCRMMAYSLLC